MQVQFLESFPNSVLVGHKTAIKRIPNSSYIRSDCGIFCAFRFLWAFIWAKLRLQKCEKYQAPRGFTVKLYFISPLVQFFLPSFFTERMIVFPTLETDSLNLLKINLKPGGIHQQNKSLTLHMCNIPFTLTSLCS